MRMIKLKIRISDTINKKSLVQNLFLAGWSLMVIHLYINYSSLSAYSNSIVSMVAFIFFLVKIAETRYSVKEIILCSFLIFFGILSLQNSQDMRALWFAIVIMASKNIDIEKTIKVTYGITVMCCLLFYVFCLLGISENETIYMSNGNIRYGFGLGHPNTLQAYVLYIISMAIYVNYERMKGWFLVACVLLACFIYSFTYSRTGLIIVISVLIMTGLIRFLPSRSLISRGLVYIISLYILVFSLLPMIYYRYINPFFYMLNDLLTYRISQAAYFFRAYGTKLFGDCPIELTYEKKYIYLDMGYASMMVCQGLVYFLIIVVSMIFLLNKYVKEKCYKKILLLVSFILFLGTENAATYIFMNISMLFISEIIFTSAKQISRSEI